MCICTHIICICACTHFYSFSERANNGKGVSMFWSDVAAKMTRNNSHESNALANLNKPSSAKQQLHEQNELNDPWKRLVFFNFDIQEHHLNVSI